jgi:hypothetical protein
MEFNIDCMKYRKSTHLASVDIEAIIAEKKSCVLTIKLAFYDTNVDVNGKKQDAYFLEFEESVKNMIVNSGNRKKISKLVSISKNLTAVESRNIGNWTGLKLNLIIDHNRKLKGETVDGIDIDTNYQQAPKKTLNDAKTTLLKVNDRESFEQCLRNFFEFTKNPEIIEICTELSIKYPKQ